MAQYAIAPAAKGLAPKQVVQTIDKYQPALNKGACILSEDFEGGVIPAGWGIGPQVEQQDDNTGVGLGTFVDAWVVGTATDANNGGYFTIPDAPAGNLFAYANDDGDPCNCDMTNVGLETPSMDFTGLTDMAVSFRGYVNDNFGGDDGAVEVSTDGGTTYTMVAPIISVETAWQNLVVDLSAYDGLPDVRVRFMWTDGGSWAVGAAVDDVCVAPILPNNMTLVAAFISDATYDAQDPALRSLEYTNLPLEQASAMSVGAAVVNNGGLTQTNVVLSVDITSNGSTNTYTSAPRDFAPGERDTLIIATGWTPSATGAIDFAYALTADSVDQNPGDNVDSRSMNISGPALADGSNVMSRDKGAASSFTGNGGDGYRLGTMMEIELAGSMAYGIGVAFGAGSDVGTVVQAELLDGNLDFVEGSDDYEVTADDLNTTGGSTFAYIPLSNPVALDAMADYVPVINHFGGATDVRIANSGTPPAQTAFLFDYTDQTWYYVLATPMVRLFLGSAVGIEEATNNGLTLGPNMPNPFNGNTTIQYELTDARKVSFQVMDVNGKVVFEQYYGTKGAGIHLVDFNASQLSAGVYSYTLTADETRLTRRMVVSK